jgi:hypothetical protein
MYADIDALREPFSVAKMDGWSLDKTMTTNLILNAFKITIVSRACKPGRLLHSDRGVQYRAEDSSDFLCIPKYRPPVFSSLPGDKAKILPGRKTVESKLFRRNNRQC